VSIRFGSNIASLSAQRRLGQVTSQLSTTFDHLSSGLRITRASDDAAGLAVADSLRVDQRVFNQAVRNINDGVSLLSIADGALESAGNILSRLSELATQASNGTYGIAQRKALDKEAQTLAKEFTRIVQSTEFNGLDLLNGSLGDVRLQAGFGGNGGIVSGLGGAIGDATFGSGSTITNFSNSTGKTVDFNGDGNLDLVSSAGVRVYVQLGNGDGTFTLGTSYSVSAAISLADTAVGDFNNDGFADIVALDVATTSGILLGNGDGSFRSVLTISYSAGGSNNIEVFDLNGDGFGDILSGTSSAGVQVKLGNGDGTFRLTSNYNYFSSGSASAQVIAGDFNGDGAVDLAGSVTGIGFGVLLGNGDGTFRGGTSYNLGNGSAITSGDYNGDGITDLAVAGTNELFISLGRGNGTFSTATSISATSPGRVVTGDFNGDGIADLFSSAGAGQIFLGRGGGLFASPTSTSALATGLGDFNNDGVFDSFSSSGIALGGTTQGTGPILPFDLSSIFGARQALPVFSRKLEQIGVQRGKIGAFESRATAALNTLTVASENLAEAGSRIRDVDVADEAARLTRLNILQKSASAVLAQANQQPKIGLDLLKDN